MSFDNESFPTNCTIDVDCDPYNTNRMCFAGASWLQDDQSECLCNNYYGWQGSDCTEYGVGTFLSMFAFGALACVCLVLFLHCFHVLVQRSRQSPTSPFIRLTARNTTTMFLTCSFFSTVAFNVVTVLNFAVNEGTPSDFFVTNNDGFGRYEWWGRNLFSPAAAFFVVMAELNVCLMWIDISTQAKHLKPSALQNLGKSKKIIICTQIALVVLMALALFLFPFTEIPLIGLVSAPFPIICSVLYIRGAREITALLRTPTSQNSTQQETNFNEFVSTVNKLTRRIVSLNIFFVITFGAYALTQGDAIIRELSPAGHIFTVEKVTHHADIYAGCFLGVVLWEYLRSTGPSTVAKKKTIETVMLFRTNDSFTRGEKSTTETMTGSFSGVV